jgi:hypothetical protein
MDGDLDDPIDAGADAFLDLAGTDPAFAPMVGGPGRGLPGAEWSRVGSVYHHPINKRRPALAAADANPTLLDPAPQAGRKGVRGNNPSEQGDMLVKIVRREDPAPTKAEMLAGDWTHYVPALGNWSDPCDDLGAAYGLMIADAATVTVEDLV